MDKRVTFFCAWGAIGVFCLGIWLGAGMQRESVAMKAEAARIEAKPAPALFPESPAIEARLIGRCNGVYMAALEESAFPMGCQWIEPIKEESR